MEEIGNWAVVESKVFLARIQSRRSRCAHTGACLALFLGVFNYGAVWAEGDASLIEIVATGPRLSSANASSPSPIVVLDNDALLHQGAVRTADFLNTLPQVNSGLILCRNGP